MQRRDFLKNTMITATGMLMFPALSRGGNIEGTLREENFLNPTAGYRPQAFWVWLNGHISKEGIRKDLEAMKQMGLGGALLFNTEGAVPRGPVDMGGDQWRSLVLYTMQEAQRLQLQITMQNSAGFSGTGGPFIQPEQSMQQLVWRTIPSTPGRNQYHIPQPFTKLGYYRDIAVLAFPESPVPLLLKLLLNGKEENPDACSDQHPETALRLEKTGDIIFEFKEEGIFQSVTIWRKPEVRADVYDGPPDSPPTFQLESSLDGLTYSTVCTIVMTQLRKMNAPGAAVFPAVKAKYLRLRTNISTWLSEVQWHTHAGVDNWPGKANFYQHVAANAPTAANTIKGIDKSKVLDLTSLLQGNGDLLWEPPAGQWTILRIGHTATGQLGASQPDAAVGLELDKFSRQAVDDWFRHMDEYLFNALQPYMSFRGLLLDSWEVGVQNWTQQMPEAFQQQNNYAITQWLPALTGRIVENAEATNAFLFNFRSTQATMVAKEYYAGFKEHCVAKGWHLWGEPYGDGMFDSLQISQELDLPMGEFWTRYTPGTMNTVSVALSAGHTSGKRVIGAEAFTGMPEMSRWTDYPYSLKVQGDHFYALGINQLILSVIVHQPYEYGLPGMCMGPFGAHFDRTNTWAPFAHGWTSYLTRTQYMLQQGHYVADFVFFKGEEPAAAVPDIDNVTPPNPIGYGADVIGPDALMQEIQIINNKIVFPDGMTYKVMVMIALRHVSLKVLQRMKTLVEAGMQLVVNEKPEAAPGLEGDASAMHVLINELWGELDGVKVKEHKLGKGNIFKGKLLPEIVQLPPDFSYTAPRRDAAIRFTHRRTADADIYFASNRLRRHEHITAEFRVKGMLPELWNAEDGSITDAVMYQSTENGIRVPLAFSPAGSWLVVFRKPLPSKGIELLKKNDQLLCSVLPAAANANYWAQVQQTFSIEVWIKPDTYTRPGKGFVVYPAEGELIYGKGYACAGIAAGQNVIRLCERTKGAAYFSKDVVAVYQPVSGWTHVVAVYDNGAPTLYINGKPAGRAEAGENKVIPGLGTKPTGELHSSVFEGNTTEPKLYREALSPQKITALYAAKLPAPELPDGLSLRRQGNIIKAMVWQNGNYRLGVHEIKVTDKCAVQMVNGPWQLYFEQGRGAPLSIHLPELISLHRHPLFNVQHFSGMVTYEKRFNISPASLQKGKRVFLDLGRVEVVANVSINGKETGLCWKEPYRLDVTRFIKPGENSLSIQVATLWPNRQIGDEQLPPENSFTTSHYISTMPDWFIQNKPSQGERITFATWNNYKPDDPLLEAGLLGPVRLIIGWELPAIQL